MKIKFRVAGKKDIKDIIELTNECFDENTSLAYAKKIYKKNQHDKNQIYIVGEVDGKIVTHAKVQVIPTIYEEMNTYAILNHVCVKPEMRRAHIGTKLLDVCFKVAKQHKCKKVELWSKNFRVAAHALYHKYGFEVMDAKFFERNV